MTESFRVRHFGARPVGRARTTDALPPGIRMGTPLLVKRGDRLVGTDVLDRERAEQRRQKIFSTDHVLWPRRQTNTAETIRSMTEAARTLWNRKK